jgi:hypothetical protein
MDKLIENNFAKRNKNGILLAQGRKGFVFWDMYTILSFYNNKIRGILNFYSFAGNRSSLDRIF